MGLKNKREIGLLTLWLCISSLFMIMSFSFSYQGTDPINDIWNHENEEYGSGNIDITDIATSEYAMNFRTNINTEEDMLIAVSALVSNGTIDIVFLGIFVQNNTLRLPMVGTILITNTVTNTTTQLGANMYENEGVFGFYWYIELENISYVEGIISTGALVDDLEDVSITERDFYPNSIAPSDFEINDYYDEIFESNEEAKHVFTGYEDVPSYDSTIESEQNLIEEILNDPYRRYMAIIIIVLLVGLVGVGILMAKKQ